MSIVDKETKKNIYVDARFSHPDSMKRTILKSFCFEPAYHVTTVLSLGNPNPAPPIFLNPEMCPIPHKKYHKNHYSISVRLANTLTKLVANKSG